MQLRTIEVHTDLSKLWYTLTDGTLRFYVGAAAPDDAQLVELLPGECFQITEIVVSRVQRDA